MLPRKKSNKKFTHKKFEVPAYIYQALDMLRPPEEITVSQWAKKYRLLDERSSAMSGYWKNSVTPYLAGIMDEFSNWSTEKIVFCKPTQVGGTEAMNNMLAYAAAQDPAPCMIVEPTEEMAESFSDNRLVPMFTKSPALKAKFNRRASSKMELQLDGMYIALTGSNSPSGLASKPIRYLFLDEVDKYPAASKTEADPVSLAIERTKTFANRKIYMCSTPTTTAGKIWREKESCDIERHYFVPCPHCHEFIELKFSNLRFPKKDDLSDADRAELATYVCQECGGVITDADKIAMLQKGEWRDIKKKGRIARSVAFWINTLYSPFTRFSDIAKSFLIAKDDPEILHNFTNSWLAEPWQETRQETTESTVKERETSLDEFTVPDWCKLLTAGVDVQESSLYYVVRAWGDFMTSQLVTRGQVLSFRDIENVMNAEYHKENGDKVLVDLCLIDSGDQTDDVYNFTAQNSEWCLPCKGTSSMLSHYKISSINKTYSRAYGMNLVLIDGGKYKDMISGRMRKENGRGSWMVFKDIDLEYCQQVTAEHKITERSSNGSIRYRWVPKTSHADNHFLDCEVYSFAAADVLGVRSLFLQEEQTAGKVHSRNETDEEALGPDRSIKNSENTGSNWYNINITDDWLNGGSF